MMSPGDTSLTTLEVELSWVYLWDSGVTLDGEQLFRAFCGWRADVKVEKISVLTISSSFSVLGSFDASLSGFSVSFLTFDRNAS